MKIKVTAFDELVNQIDIREIDKEQNAAAVEAGFAVETYLRRINPQIKYITVKRE